MVKARAVDQLLKLGDRFGMSPTARVGLARGGSDGPAPAGLGGHDDGSLLAYLRQKPDRLPGDTSDDWAA